MPRSTSRITSCATFAARTFDEAGRLRTEVMGSEARHYPDTLQLEIEQVRIRSYDPQGRLTTASADRAPDERGMPPRSSSWQCIDRARGRPIGWRPAQPTSGVPG